MRKILVIAAVAMSVASTSAIAQERVGSAALGALSGAVVLGPVGAVAGAAIGYTAGPAIARSWGIRGASRGRQAHAASRSAPVNTASRAPQTTSPNKMASTPRTSGKSADVTGSVPTPSAKPPVRSAHALPPTQGFE
jgi:hypothetical protein